MFGQIVHMDRGKNEVSVLLDYFFVENGIYLIKNRSLQATHSNVLVSYTRGYDSCLVLLARELLIVGDFDWYNVI